RKPCCRIPRHIPISKTRAARSRAVSLQRCIWEYWTTFLGGIRELRANTSILRKKECVPHLKRLSASRNFTDQRSPQIPLPSPPDGGWFKKPFTGSRCRLSI